MMVALEYVPSVPEFALILAAVFTVIFIHYIKTYNYWSNRGIKQVARPLPLAGNSFDVFLKPSHEVEIERYKKYGRIYGIYDGVTPVLIVAEPELLRKIFVKDFNIFPERRIVKGIEPLFDNFLSAVKGERWKSMRSIVSQTFSSGKMRRLVPLIDECIQSLIDNFTEEAKKNKPIDCKRLLSAFTMDVIISCAFGTKIDSHKDPNNPFVKYASEVFGRRMSVRVSLSNMAPAICRTLGLRFLRNEVREFFCTVTRRLIQERKSKKQHRNDFLQLILEASDLNSKESKKDAEDNDDDLGSMFKLENNDGNRTKLAVSGLKDTANALTEMEVLSQCLLFFAAGYETTATALTYSLYHLAINPEAQEKLRQEVDMSFEKHGNIDYDKLIGMHYLDAVISEVMRINSLVSRLERIAAEDYLLGDTGITIEKGTVIVIPIYAMHLDEEWFPEPNKFKPERFLPENKDNIVPYTYMPFGAGPRNCVAMRFALMEAKICLAKLIRNFKFSVSNQTKVPPNYKTANLLTQPIGIILDVERRTL